MASGGKADLPRIRAVVGRALEDFLDRQRVRLSAIGEDMMPCLDATTDLLAAGKRLRPAFCYWGWRAAGGEDCPQVFAAAAALELLHASALVHDDVMDGSDTRRGQPAVHRRFAARHVAEGWQGSAEAFGAGAAILIGDLLLAWTDELFHASGLPQAALRRGQPVLDTMRTEVFSGQYLDLAGQAAGSITVQSALRVVTFKAAKYTIERPLHLGMALAAGDGQLGAGQAALSAALTAYGIPLGIAFQLRDDILGVFGDPAVTGKPVSDDVREGKRTVLMAIARERADAEQARLLECHLGDPSLSDAAAAEVRKIIAETGALAESERAIDMNITEALAALAGAPITQVCREALGDLAVAATARRD
jgi:geranylgeranyl diphosphate synthase, type I